VAAARPDRGADKLVNDGCADVFAYVRCANKFVIHDMCGVTKRVRINESWHTQRKRYCSDSRLKLSNVPGARSAGGNAQRRITRSTQRLFSRHQGLCVRMFARRAAARF